MRLGVTRPRVVPLRVARNASVPERRTNGRIGQHHLTDSSHQLTTASTATTGMISQAQGLTAATAQGVPWALDAAWASQPRVATKTAHRAHALHTGCRTIVNSMA